MPCVIPPFYGEFGWLVMHHLRYVHQHPEKEKIVCCEPGSECLYPSATAFHYTRNPIPDDNRQNAGAYRHKGEYSRYHSDLLAELRSTYPGCTIDTPKYDCPWHWSNTIKFRPEAPAKLPAVDVVLGARKRAFDTTRNYAHWPAVVTALSGLGLCVGLAGLPDTSLDMPAVVKAWEHPAGPTAGTVDLLSRCRMYAGLDSGVSHLAALMDVPMTVIPPVRNSTPDYTGVMKRANRNTCRVLSTCAWNGPEEMTGAVVLTLTV